jgi:hypothetical protein
MKFLNGHGQWWYINAVFNKPSKKEIAWRTGWPREKVIFSICSTSDPALWKNVNEKHSYIHVKGEEFSLLQSVQTGSEVHPTSYPMGTGGSFLGGKAAGA